MDNSFYSRKINFIKKKHLEIKAIKNSDENKRDLYDKCLQLTLLTAFVINYIFLCYIFFKIYNSKFVEVYTAVYVAQVSKKGNPFRV